MRTAMPWLITFSLFLALAAGGCGPQPSAGPDQESTVAFQAFINDYLAWRYENAPTWATNVGNHTFDDQLPDMSLAAQEARHARMKEFAERLAAIDPARLSLDDAIDHEILSHHFALEDFRFTRIADYRRSPMLYSGIATGSVYSLVKRDFAPAEERFANALARIRAVPKVLEQARECLENPTEIYTKTAIAQARGGVAFFRNTLPPMAAGLSIETEFAAACDTAAQALSDYATWLETELLPRATGDWRIGAEMYDEYLPILLNIDMTADQVLERAEKEFAATRATIAQIAGDNWELFKPGVPKPADETELVKAVFDVIASQHTTPDAVLSTVKRDVEEIKTFIRDKKIIPLPEPDRLEVIEMPRFEAGRSMAYNDQPPALEPEGKSFYAVTPFLENWDQNYIESFLREYNDRMIKILTIHEAYPGHFVQGWYAGKSPSLIRKLFHNGPYVEGWAVYTETVMLENGFGGGDPAMALMRYKFLLRAIANAIIDQKLHKGLMTDEELVTFLIDQTYQERTEAEAKLTRAKLSYGQLATYFIGWIEMMDLREAYKAKVGDAFNQSDYHVAVVSHGAPPVRLLKKILLEQ